MSKPFQLQIPTPCHENWANMQPSDKGRHCAACQKTVVDFTAMSDTEIIRYMSKASANVCGRFTSGQVNRPLIPLTPPQKNRLPGWPLLLTGIFFTHDKSMSHPPLIQTTHEQPPSSKDTLISTPSVLLGDTTLLIPDPVENPTPKSLTRIDTESLQIPDTSILIANPDTTTAPLEQVLTGAVQCPRPRTIDTIKQLLIDTLSALRLLPQKQPLTPINNELTVYPNPVQRGIPFRLAWQTDPGKYQISLFSSSGALIQQRIIDISSSKQVSDWQIPTNAPAGIYIIRALQPGQTRVYARELVVQ
jgi:hypothetical protein